MAEVPLPSAPSSLYRPTVPAPVVDPPPDAPEVVPLARRFVQTAAHWEAVCRAFHDPELTYPGPYGKDDQECRRAGLCLLLVDVATGWVLSVHHLEYADDDGASVLLALPAPKRRGRRGGAGRRGPSDYRELHEMLKAEGCVVELVPGSGHYRISFPDGQATQISATPSDYRTLSNEVARLRRRGLKLSKF
jgi:hypothetical protein